MNTKHITLSLVLALAAVSASALTFETRNASIRPDDTGHLLSNGTIAEYVQFHAGGRYEVRVVALGQPLGGIYPVMALSVDGYTADEISVNSGSWVEYSFETWFQAGVYSVGVAFLNDAMSATEDRNLGLTTISVIPLEGQAGPSLSTAAAWLTSAQGRENALVDATTESIREHRMGGATIYVTDSAGNPVVNATVRVEQESHDFLFGASFAGYQTFGDSAQNAEYERLFKNVFNYATLPFYWSVIEPVSGQVDYPRLDSMVNWCENNGIAMKGHALLWAMDGAMPAWMGGMPSEAEMQAHVATLTQRYAGRIGYWEVVNEPFNEPGIGFAAPHGWTRLNDPAGKLVVNEYGQFYNGLLGFWDMVAAAKNAGVPVDAVGIQGHAPVDTAYPMERIQDILDLYAQLGVEVHITELTPPSNGVPVTGAPWRTVWNEATQADYAEKLYRVCFAHPSVSAISWWDFSDHGAWTPGGGLVRADLSPKASYNALDRLINEEWNTSTEGATYTGGGFYFNGFYGSYTVTVEFEGQNVETSFHLTRGAGNTLTVSLDGVAPAAPAAVTVNSLSTTDTTPTLTGTVTNASSVSVTVNGTNYYAATVSGNAWQATVSHPLADGVYDVQATATGEHGATANDTTTNELRVDTQAPVITLSGGAAIEMEAGETFTEPGYTAADNLDGDLTAQVTVTGAVDTEEPGSYTLTYRVADSLNNTATATRTVTVTETRSQTAIGMIGDLNNDGVIEEFDVTLMNYLLRWGQTNVNTLLTIYGMKRVDARLADIDMNGTVDSWDANLLNWTLIYGLDTVNAYLASIGRPLARVGEIRYE